MAAEGTPGGEETLEGTLEQIVFQSPESHFTVARVRVAARAELVTAVGGLAGVAEGTDLRLSGRWVTDRKFGAQFKVESYRTVTPATVAGIERYLGSGVIPGIGPELARRLVARFGTETLEIVGRDPARLTEVDGIGRARAERIRERWQEQRALEDVMVFLQGHGVSPAFANRIWRRYGTDAIGIVRSNPYRLALDIAGIGFRSADAIARSLGVLATAPARAEAGLLHVLGELADDGHMHAPTPSLLAAARETLAVGDEILEPAVLRLVGAGRLVAETLGDRGECVSLAPLHAAEARAALLLGRLAGTAHAKTAVGVDINIDAGLARYEAEAKLVLAPQQRLAVAAAAHDKVVVITGGPGVGKTTIVRALLALVEGPFSRILLASPTGRAAKRLAETTLRPAMTIHRLLEYQPRTGGFGRDEAHPLDCELLVIDEASMIDTLLFAAVCAALPPTARLVLVGDVDQLPSVGPGRVLADVIASGRATVVRLTQVFRQAAQSAIVTNAHRVHRGELPDLEPHEDADFFFIERDEPARVLETMLEVVAERIPRRFGLDPFTDVQVLTPMHKGEVGSLRLGAELQARLNPPGPSRPELVRGPRTFRLGDKVLQVKNDYDKDVWNGDVGRVTRLESASPDKNEHRLVIDFDGREVGYSVDELDALAHGYALTVHKAQGSEYPAVVIPLVTQHFMLLQRNLLYTAITRARRLCVLVGSRKALGIAVRTDDTRLRWTWLARRLADAPTGL